MLGDIIWLPGKDLASSEAKSGSPLHRGPSTKTHTSPSHTIPSHQAQAPSSPAAASISETYELLAACCYHLFAMVETLPRAAPARASPARSCPPPVHCTFLASISFPAAWPAAIVGRRCCVEASHQHALAAALCCPRLQPSSVPAPGMPPATAAHS